MPEITEQLINEMDPLLSESVQEDLSRLADRGAKIYEAEKFKFGREESEERPLVLGMETAALAKFVETHSMKGYTEFRKEHSIYPEGDENGEYKDTRKWAEHLFEKVAELRIPVVFVVDSQIDTDFESEEIDVSYTQAEYEWLVDHYQGQFPLTIVIGLEGQNIYLK